MRELWLRKDLTQIGPVRPVQALQSELGDIFWHRICIKFDSWWGKTSTPYKYINIKGHGRLRVSNWSKIQSFIFFPLLLSFPNPSSSNANLLSLLCLDGIWRHSRWPMDSRTNMYALALMGPSRANVRRILADLLVKLIWLASQTGLTK